MQLIRLLKTVGILWGIERVYTIPSSFPVITCEQLSLVFTQWHETQKTIDIAALLVSQTKEIVKIILLIIH